MAERTLDILVVDDESELRNTLADAFRRDGHRVTAVPDGRSAVDRATTDRFDIVLLAIGPLMLDRTRREVTVERRQVELTFSEFELLEALMASPGRLFNRQELLRAIWGDSAYRDPRGIDVHVRHLREKLEQRPERPTLIVTVRGGGYRLEGG